MSLDLEYGDEQVALATSVRGFCDRHLSDDVVRGDVQQLSVGWWRGLGDLGVLGLATDEGGGGALEIAAVGEVLGAAGYPGPVAITHVGCQLLTAQERQAIVAGEAVVTVGTAPLVPWAPVADVIIELADGKAWLAEVDGGVQPVETTAGEPWGEVRLQRMRPLPDPTSALALGDVAIGAFLVGAGSRLLDLAAGYAADREQFGQPIGQFQAVAHPLADVELRLRAARHLVRTAAHAHATASAPDADADAGAVVASAAAARLSATRAALDATYRAHQTFGAMGFTVEGPVAHLGRRIRQVSLHLPGPGRLRAAVLDRHGVGAD